MLYQQHNITFYFIFQIFYHMQTFVWYLFPGKYFYLSLNLSTPSKSVFEPIFTFKNTFWPYNYFPGNNYNKNWNKYIDSNFIMIIYIIYLFLLFGCTSFSLYKEIFLLFLSSSTTLLNRWISLRLKITLSLQ